MTLPETLKAVRQWFGERGLPGRVQTIVGSPIDEAIAALGYMEVDGPALRQSAPVLPALDILSGTTDSHIAEVTKELPADYFTVYRRGLGIPEFQTILTTGDADIAFAVVRGDDGKPLSVGRVAIDPTTRHAGIAAVATAEHARRRGLARIVLRDLLAFSKERGAESTYLEVEEQNAPARALYESLGYLTAHRYHCRLL
jgi:GNAT superfamily N-acetyltransferase